MAEPWYIHAVFYEISVKAFQDSNGDGIGDIPGLISRLPYLEELGVTCLWLLPLFPSPGMDDGYDVSDYYGIDPKYGTLDDFKKLIAKAHKRGIRIITELILNHTSDAHPWFREARKGVESPYHDYYVWSDTWQKYEDAPIVFSDTETSNWAWCDECKKYYWHRFFTHQPDLNYDNPAVREEMMKVVSFWFELGVDGLRFDAVPYIFEREGTNCENLPETHAFIREIRRLVDERYPDRMLLAEANQWPEDLVQYFGQGDQFHTAYHFPLMPRIFMALKQEHHGPIVDILMRTPSIPETCQWLLFLRNHDELTLEMCTDSERDYMYQAYADDRDMRINKGIRRRLAPLAGNDRRKIELLTALLLTLPGSPVIYYGDEIGMGDNLYLGDRNGVRTPMHWNEDRNAGFSAGLPSKLYAPVILDPEYNYHTVNVDVQKRNPNSLYHFLKNLIAKRKKNSCFGSGSLQFFFPENKKTLIYVREDGNSIFLCVFNLAGSAQAVEIDLAMYRTYVPVELLSGSRFPPIGDLPYLLSLAPYGFFIFELEPS
ncbi:MAG TPA: maltose alpha-D-glucosyltransferase [Spirochaetia bacterium]|nr:maltose alpha-D-glucosyltransferase [Spirochaetia bacterium]